MSGTEHDPTLLPEDLPAPVDDGACDHLPGRPLPDLALPASSSAPVNLARLPDRTVVFCFPRAGRPGVAPPAGWDAVPGARGCTVQNQAFARQYDKIRALHAAVYGLSTQSAVEQQEITGRLQLPFPLLSDAALDFATALGLPVFAMAGDTMIRRLTLVVTEGVIEHVFYPVFPPDQAADEVIVWLLAHPRRPSGAL